MAKIKAKKPVKKSRPNKSRKSFKLNKLNKQRFSLPVNLIPDLPAFYGKNKVVLMAKDPWWIFSYWEVTPEREREARERIQRKHLEVDQKILRVFDVTFAKEPGRCPFFDVVVGNSNSWYLDVGKPNRQWAAELGLRSTTGFFTAMVRSNLVHTPHHGVSEIVDEKWTLPGDVFWKIAQLSGGVPSPKSSWVLAEADASKV